jgi:hypothetical protein
VPSWLLKAAAQGAISLLPGRHRLNRVLQQHVTKSLALSQTAFEAKVAQCRHHLTGFERGRGAGQRPRVVLELGTGWYPIVPLGLALAGATQVTTLDVSPLLERASVLRVIELYEGALADGRLAGALPGIDLAHAESLLQAARARSDGSASDLLAALGVRSEVGGLDVVALPSESVDLLVSNNTLEHVPAGQLAEIMGGFRRLAAPGAVMDHFIDLSDHYAHFDRAIGEFNYLRFSPTLWRLFNNPLQFQNRLRVSDYRSLIEQAGFRVIAEESQRGSAAELASVRLAAQFRRYEQTDLLVLRSWITAVAPG